MIKWEDSGHLPLLKEMKIIKIIEDKTIHANSAIIESPESRIDARLETQIAQITGKLMKIYSEEPVLEEIVKDCHSELDSESNQIGLDTSSE